MRFRPCIDIHNGQVKQIVGGSLRDEGDVAEENFVSQKEGDFFAELYKKYGLSGGHIILLNPASSEYYEADLRQAKLALSAYPGGLQIGGGINAGNAETFIDMGASHVIATSFVFRNGEINYDNLRDLEHAVGREHLVLDLSCRKKDGEYYIVTDRWQKFTNVIVNQETLDELADIVMSILSMRWMLRVKQTELRQSLPNCFLDIQTSRSLTQAAWEVCTILNFSENTAKTVWM